MELKQLRAEALSKADALRQKVSSENRAMTDEERSEFEGYLNEIDRLNTQIELEQRFATERAKQNETREDQRTRRPDGGPIEVHDNAEDEPFRDIGQQLTAVRAVATSRHQVFDPRLRKFDVTDPKVRAAAGLNEAVGSEGGFLLGVETGSMIEKVAFETGVLARRTRRIPLSGNSVGIKLPYINETSRANGSRWGGVRAYWQNEAEATTATKPEFGVLELGLNKLMALCHATDELLMDAAALGSVITQAVGEEFGFVLDDAIYRGTGAGVPLGILNASCLISVAKEGSQAAATILFANVSKMRLRILPRSWPRAEWFLNQDTLHQIEKMFVPHTNVAGTENVGGQNVFVPPGGLTSAPFGTLYGRPINVIEHAETLGTKGDIALLDLSEYLMTQKGGMQSASSIHVNFLTDQTAFRFIMRIDGKPARKSAITPYKGSNSLSPFIVLDTRA